MLETQTDGARKMAMALGRLAPATLFSLDGKVAFVTNAVAESRRVSRKSLPPALAWRSLTAATKWRTAPPTWPVPA